MTDIPNTPSFEHTMNLLEDERLHETLHFLRSIKHTLTGASHISDEAALLYAELQRLFDQTTAGADSNLREVQLGHIYEKTWDLCDQLYDLEAPLPDTISPDQLTSALTDLRQNPTDDDLLGQLFDHIADRRRMTHDERELINAAILDDNLPEYVRATLLSAVSLKLTQWFDTELVDTLYVYTLDDQPVQIQMQAFVTMALVAICHPDRIKYLTRIQEQFQLVSEANPGLVFDLLVAILLCREARYVEKQMHTIVSKFDEDDKEETNEANMLQLLSLVHEGLDMSFLVFEKKSKMDFFSKPGTRHHWLLPFSLEHPTIRQAIDRDPKMVPFLTMMKESVAQCDTDKYLSFISMLAIGGDNLLTTFSEKLNKSGIRFMELGPIPPISIVRSYLHNLYRYFELHPQGRNHDLNPFHLGGGIIWANPLLKQAFDTPDKLKEVGELLFRKERWDEARLLFIDLLDMEVSEMALQRTAYAVYHSSSYNDEMALTYLRRCNQLYPGNLWTLKMMADLQHNKREYTSEEATLRDALSQRADDTHLLTRLGRCLNCQHRYKEALEPLFKADLLKEGRRNTQRELALALLATGDRERAKSYSELSLAHKNTDQEDHMVSMFLALAEGDIRKAVRELDEKGKASIERIIYDHSDLMTSCGVKPVTLTLVKEMVDQKKNHPEELCPPGTKDEI